MKKTYPNMMPVKLDGSDSAQTDLLCARSGLAKSEVVRRSLRLLAQEARDKPEWNWVMATAKPLPPLTEKEQAEIEAVSPEKFAAVNDRARAASEAGRRRK